MARCRLRSRQRRRNLGHPRGQALAVPRRSGAVRGRAARRGEVRDRRSVTAEFTILTVALVTHSQSRGASVLVRKHQECYDSTRCTRTATWTKGVGEREWGSEAVAAVVPVASHSATSASDDFVLRHAGGGHSAGAKPPLRSAHACHLPLARRSPPHPHSVACLPILVSSPQRPASLPPRPRARPPAH